MSYSSISVDPSHVPASGQGFVQSFLLEFNSHRLLAALAALPILLWMFTAKNGSLPVLNPRKLNELTIRGRILDFGRRSKELFLEGRDKFKKNPYTINCEWGNVVVLHPDFINEIRNLKHMNFAIPTSDVSFCHGE